MAERLRIGRLGRLSRAASKADQGVFGRGMASKHKARSMSPSLFENFGHFASSRESRIDRHSRPSCCLAIEEVDSDADRAESCVDGLGQQRLCSLESINGFETRLNWLGVDGCG